MPDQDLFLQRALMEAGLLNNEQFENARQYASEHELDLVDALVRTETLSARQIALTKADICEAPFVALQNYEPHYGNTSLVPRNIAEIHCVFPLFMVDGVLTLVMDDPLNLEAADHVRQIAHCEVDAVLAEREQIRELIARAYSLGQSDAAAAAQDVETEAEADEASQPVVAAVNQMLADALAQRASDIHVNPDDRELHLRYRVDGVLQRKQGPPLSMHAGLVQRLKVMAHLDLTQTRRPQDGKFRFRYSGRRVDVRMSTIPTVNGENVVLRLLTNAQAFGDFLDLGVPAPLAEQVVELIHHPHGILLVTGPTGSGKTTTLYTAISKLNDLSRNIMTIEDPVEIRLPYVRQVQVNHEIGLSFPSALRSILRQDPDIVLVGEIRDNETASIALQAALTGHMVLSTLHTNDAVGAVSRMRDYGLAPFVINSAVLGVVAQRLVRRVCEHCRAPDEVDDLLRQRFNLLHTDSFVRGEGCGRCGQTGYRGRVGLYELMAFTLPIKQLVDDGASTDRIRRLAVRNGMRLMWQDGIEKARLGVTTLEEVAKVASMIEIQQPSLEERLVA